MLYSPLVRRPVSPHTLSRLIPFVSNFKKQFVINTVFCCSFALGSFPILFVPISPGSDELLPSKLDNNLAKSRPQSRPIVLIGIRRKAAITVAEKRTPDLCDASYFIKATNAHILCSHLGLLATGADKIHFFLCFQAGLLTPTSPRYNSCSLMHMCLTIFQSF